MVVYEEACLLKLQLQLVSGWPLIRCHNKVCFEKCVIFRQRTHKSCQAGGTLSGHDTSVLHINFYRYFID